MNNRRINRREFINVVGAGMGAVCALPLVSCATAAAVGDDHGIPYVDEDRLIVALMGDPQYPMTTDTAANIQIAMDDLLNVPHDFLAVLGDLVQNQPAYYEKYTELVLDQSAKPVHSLAGNGDKNAGLQAHQDATGHPLWYAINRRGIRFIFTSTTYMSGATAHICHMGAEQLAWLQSELAADTESTTVICSHPPVFETTWHSEDRSAQPAPGSMYLGESAEMRQLFAQYPNIKMFAHGHLHYGYGVKDEFNRDGWFLENNVLHISVGATANNRGSSILYIEEDKMVVKVRDHGNETWKSQYEYVYPVQTTLKPATAGVMRGVFSKLR
jgi:3',5'-cyclic AMP phosphodiesterase CpdA